MADIELVIKINEDDVHRIVSGFTNEDDAVLFANLLNNGTLLPKGHRKLITEPTEEEIAKTIGGKNDFADCIREAVKIVFTNAPTIIEADTESEEKEMSKAEYDKIVHLMKCAALQDIDTGRLDGKYESAIPLEDVIAILQRIYKAESEDAE